MEGEADFDLVGATTLNFLVVCLRKHEALPPLIECTPKYFVLHRIFSDSAVHMIILFLLLRGYGNILGNQLFFLIWEEWYVKCYNFPIMFQLLHLALRVCLKYTWACFVAESFSCYVLKITTKRCSITRSIVAGQLFLAHSKHKMLEAFRDAVSTELRSLQRVIVHRCEDNALRTSAENSLVIFDDTFNSTVCQREIRALKDCVICNSVSFVELIIQLL